MGNSSSYAKVTEQDHIYPTLEDSLPCLVKNFNFRETRSYFRHENVDQLIKRLSVMEVKFSVDNNRKILRKIETLQKQGYLRYIAHDYVDDIPEKKKRHYNYYSLAPKGLEYLRNIAVMEDL